MASYISQSLRDRVRQRAKQRCEYCQSAEWLTGLHHELDHILPRHLGGMTSAENLCLACSTCNSYKHGHIEAIDPYNRETVPLYNPRSQSWSEHFAWDEGSTHIIGITAIGRATVEALHMNHATVVVARSLWISTGHHPPS